MSFDDFKVYRPGIEGATVETQKKLTLDLGKAKKIPLNHNLCCLWAYWYIEVSIIDQIRLDLHNAPPSQVKQDNQTSP